MELAFCSSVMVIVSGWLVGKSGRYVSHHSVKDPNPKDLDMVDLSYMYMISRSRTLGPGTQTSLPFTIVSETPGATNQPTPPPPPPFLGHAHGLLNWPWLPWRETRPPSPATFTPAVFTAGFYGKIRVYLLHVCCPTTYISSIIKLRIAVRGRSLRTPFPA